MSELGPAQRVSFGIALLLLAGGGFPARRALFRRHHNVMQPVAFNHGKHTATLECGTCHLYPTQRAHSGLPGLSTCMQCHEEPQTESPEEKKIQKLAAGGQEDVFRKLFRAYYDGRRKKRGHAQKEQNIAFNIIQPYRLGVRKGIFPTMEIEP